MRLHRFIAERVGTDIRLAIIVLFAVLTVAGVSPFAIARAFNGEWMIAALDAGIVTVIVASAVFAWRTGRAALVGMVHVVLISVVFAILAAGLGTAALFWTYPLVVANYMLAPRWLATSASLLLIASSAYAASFPSGFVATAFAVSALLVMLYSFVFASLTEAQRAQLHRLATRDPLTGVANRRSMEIELADALRLHQARGTAAALAVLDLDHFKLVNDRHGHDAGDRVLVDFAQRVEKCIRKRDRLFRFGGEEFVVLLPATELDGARIALEKIRHAVESAVLGPGLAVTTSIGVAMLEPDDDWPAWLARADDALFRAKRAGRDRVEFDASPSAEGERRRRRDQVVAGDEVLTQPR